MTEPSVPAVPIMSEDDARTLIDEIRTAAGDLWEKLLRAHDGGAWKALGYASWDACVEAEFDMGKRQANRLIRHARFAGELGPVGPTISENRSRGVPEKRRPAVAKKVRKATEGLPPQEATPKAEAILAKETKRADAAKKRTANFESQEFKVNLVDPARKMLIDLAVAAGMGSDAMATRLLDDLLTTGEVPTLPTPKPAARRPMQSPALEKALARRTPVEERAVNVVQSLRRDVVEPNFKGSGKK